MEKILNQPLKVLRNIQIAEKTNLMTLRWPSNYRVRPGQFIKLVVRDKIKFSFRRPLSIADCDTKADCDTDILSLLIREAGENTAFYRELDCGQEIEVVGPLGTPFNFESLNGIDRCIFVVGGIGVAPLLFIAKQAASLSSSASLTFIYGEKYLESLIEIDRLPFWDSCSEKIENKAILEKETPGFRKGKVTKLLIEELKINHSLKQLIIACGKIEMLREVSRIAEKANTACWVSMEAMMGCGWGACKGCAIFQKDGSVLNVCTDGPIMDGRKIDWNQFERKKVIIKRKNVVEFETEKDMFSTTLIGQKGRLLKLRYPFINASKGLGIDEVERDIVDTRYFGAFETEGITQSKRSGNLGPRLAEINGGALNSIGLQNDGINNFIQFELPRWNAFGKPVLVNISGNSPEEFVECVRKLPKVGVAAVVLNISCPNNKSADKIFALYEDLAYEVVGKCRKKRPDLFIIAKLSPRARDNVAIGHVCVKAGADALSLENTMPGADLNHLTGVLKNRGKDGIAGISGLPLQNILLRDLIELDNAQLGVPLIAIGGIDTWQTALKAIRCGANAVQACTVLYSNLHWATDLSYGLKNFMLENNIKHIQHLVGKRFL